MLATIEVMGATVSTALMEKFSLKKQTRANGTHVALNCSRKRVHLLIVFLWKVKEKCLFKWKRVTKTFALKLMAGPILFYKELLSACLEESRIHGKVVMCDFYDGIDAVKAAGALGCIAPNLGNNVSDITTFPTAALSANDFNLIKKYKLLPAIRNPDAPFVASDSSRGPSIYFPDLIKPDITAPGVEILAAFSPLAPPSGISSDNRFKSGTSVASPHIAAAAAYIKSFHPMWSPSTIKYALMTTARAMDPNHNSNTVFAYGSGNINPKKATDPEEVTNVGQSNAPMLHQYPKESSKLNLSVEPSKLEFTSQNQMISFVVTVKGSIESSLTTESVSLTWTDGIHVVRSPIVVYTGEVFSGVERASRPPSVNLRFLRSSVEAEYRGVANVVAETC
ncbi:subtilisin-like protease SBT4.3 [Tanacetum coccineum]